MLFTTFGSRDSPFVTDLRSLFGASSPGSPETGEKSYEEFSGGVEEFLQGNVGMMNMFSQNPMVMQGVHLEACNMVMSMPAVCKMIAAQMSSLVGDPNVVRQQVEAETVQQRGEKVCPAGGHCSHCPSAGKMPEKAAGVDTMKNAREAVEPPVFPDRRNTS